MPRLCLTAALSALFLTLFTATAHAASRHFQVTPSNLNTHPVGFQISARMVKTGVEYIVEVWRKPEMDPLRFSKRMDEALVKITISKKEFRVKKQRSITVPAIGRERIRYRFVATDAEAQDLAFCLGFASYSRNEKGEIQWMPAADFYWFRLSDFQPTG